MTTKFRTIKYLTRRPHQRRNKVGQTGVIIRRNKDTFVANEAFEKAIAENPTAWGAAVIDGGELNVNRGDGHDLEFFQNTMKIYPDSDITFYLCNTESGISFDDVCPYEVLSHNDKTQVVAFIEGNFPGMVQEKSSHPPEFFLANTFIAPRLAEMFEALDYDIDKLMAYTEKPIFKKDLMANAVGRGYVTLLGVNGKSVSYAIGDSSKEFPWGWMSNTYGYGEITEKKPVAEETKPKAAFPKRSTVREPAPKSSVPPIAAPKTETAVKPAPGPVAYSVGKWAPHKDASRSQKKDQYKARLGYLPKGWVNGIEVEVYKDKDGKIVNFSELKRLGLLVAGLPKLNNPEPNNNRDDKDTDTEHLPHPEAPPQEKQVTVEKLPVLNPKSREYLKDTLRRADIQKMIAENADIITDPKKVASMEEKIAGLCTQLGLQSAAIEDFLKLPFEVLVQINKERPDALEIMAWNYKNLAASLMAKKGKVEKSEETQTTQTQKVAFPKRKVG